jgi:predicted nucleic acid-binding protein
MSVLVLGEIRKGIELARPRDPAKADALVAWLAAVVAAFGERILPIDRAVADAWGRMSGQRPIPTVDGLLAATAKVHRLTLVTRNEADVAGLGAKVLNPFTEAKRRR